MNQKINWFTSVLFFLSAIAFLSLGSCKDDDPHVEEYSDSLKVIYSAWAYSGPARDTTVDNTVYKISDLPAPLLTLALREKSAVHVYMRYSKDGFLPLPYTSYAGGKANTIGFWPTPGRIIITRFTHDNSGTIGLSSALKYKYIIVPGALAAEEAGRKRGGLLPDFNDYQAVCRFYGIAE